MTPSNETQSTKPKPYATVVFSIDRFRALFRDYPGTLHTKLNIREMKENGIRVEVWKASPAAQQHGYRSMLLVEVPRPETLQHIASLAATMHYTISYIELTADSLCATKAESIERFEEIKKKLRMRYSRRTYLYQHYRWVEPDTETREKIAQKEKLTGKKRVTLHPEGTYHDETGYWGGKTFGFRLYPRISKIALRPCVRGEFRITGSKLIRKKIGAGTLSELSRLDIASAFMRMYRETISYEEIDHETHGRFLLDIHPRATSVGVVREGPRAGTRQRQPQSYSKRWIRANDIQTPAALRRYYANQKRLMKERPSANLSSLERKTKTMNQTRLDSFFTIAADPFIAAHPDE